MCSISGFSFSPDSRINARSLASALLVAGAQRGTDAAGFAAFTAQGRITAGLRNVSPKKFVRCEAFTLDTDARTVICHTRFATKGAATNPLNNHPVLACDPRSAAPGDQLALVHNGCLDNDDALYRANPDLVRRGQVDSAIIPALLAKYGSDNYARAFSEIAGSLACGWLDEAHPHFLNVARAASSPVQIAVIDRHTGKRPMRGVIFASTSSMLTAALRTLGLEPHSRCVTLLYLSEGSYFAMRDGEWDCTVTSFTFPKRSYYRDWRQGTKPTKHTSTFFSDYAWDRPQSRHTYDSWDDYAEDRRWLDSQHSDSHGHYESIYDPETGTQRLVPFTPDLPARDTEALALSRPREDDDMFIPLSIAEIADFDWEDTDFLSDHEFEIWLQFNGDNHPSLPMSESDMAIAANRAILASM